MPNSEDNHRKLNTNSHILDVDSDTSHSINPRNQSAQNTLGDLESKTQLRRAILKFTWPCLLELILISLISIVNLVMVGHLGAYAISAVGITTQPVFTSIAVFQAFNIGATALVSRFVGAGDFKNAKTVVIQTLMISTFLGALLAFLGFFFSHWIVVGMGAKSDTVAYAEIYMKYMSIGMIFQSIPTAVGALLRGAGETKAPMRFNIVSNIINVATGFIFIYGIGFIPAMGVEGAGLASTLAKVTACIMSVYTIFHIKLPIAVSLKDKFRLDFKMLKRIMRIGYAAAGEQFILRVGLLVFAKIVADLGTIPFAAHQICINILALSFNIGQSFGIASTSFVGRSLGNGRPDLAIKLMKEIRRMGIAVSIAISICFLLFGNVISGLYTNNLEVVALSTLILRIVAVIMPAQTSQLIISGGLRGAGDTRWPLISTMCGILGFRMILGTLFVKVFLWGLVGAWVAVAIDQFVRSSVIYFRYKYGKWQDTKV